MSIETRLEWHGDAVLARAKAGREMALFRAAEYLLQRSRARAPIEEGTLERDSRTEVDAGADEPVVAYGRGGARKYARRQHEELTWRHDPGRTAKYLEGPLTEETATMYRIMADTIRDYLK